MSGSYTSRESYAAPVTAPNERGQDPRAASQVSTALATGFADVSSHFLQLWARADYAQQVNDATAIVAKKSMDLADMERGFAADPDPATVPARFREQAAAFRADSLKDLSPGVQQHVGRQLDGMLATTYRQVAAGAYQRHIGNLRSTLATTIGTTAQAIAGAKDEPQLLENVQAAKQAIAGNVQAGVIQQSDATPLFSHAIRQAVTIRASAGDPGAATAAQALLDRFKPEMDAADVAALSSSLRTPLERAQGETAATAAIAMSGDVTSRARAVEAAFIAKGYTPAVARGLAANAVQESGANPNPAAGDGGRSTGLFQWNGDRRAAFVAQYGVDPGQATLQQQVDFADWELKNTEKTAGTALAAATTPEQAAKIASTQFLRPRDTAAEEPRRAGIATQLGGGIQGQRDAAVADVRARLVDAPLHVRLSAESQVAEHFTHLEGRQTQQRALLEHDLHDLQAAYTGGQTTAPIPEDRIRALAPSAEAAKRTIDGLTLARTAGDAIKAVQFASPADIEAQRARLAGPRPAQLPATVQGQLEAGNIDLARRPVVRNADGSISTVRSMSFEDNGKEVLIPTVSDDGRILSEDDAIALYRSTGKHLGKFDTPDHATAFAQALHNQQADAYGAGAAASPYLAAERGQLVAHFDQSVARMRTALKDDPAGYAMTAPEVQQLAKANAPMPDIVAASLAAQGRMGVLPGAQRVLSGDQLTRLTDTLRTTGPDKADMGATLSGIAQQFGPALWNQAFGELVHHGKLPWEWQAVAAMSAPQQAEGRSRLQHALVQIAERGGVEAYRKLGDPSEVKGIAAAVETQMSTFREAVRYHPGGDSLLDTMHRAVDTLATSYVVNGMKAPAAAQRAYEDVIGARWDTAGNDGSTIFGGTPTMLVPKGQAGAIETALDLARNRLTAAELQALPDPGRPDAAEPELARATLAAARRGIWVNNADASGAVLRGRTPGGSIVNLTRTDGRPIEVRFNALPQQAPDEPGVLPEDGTTGGGPRR